MLVTIYPGAGRQDVLDTLRSIHSKIGDAGNVLGSAVARAIAYLDWANDAVHMLEHRVSAADIDRLILTPGYARLLSATGILTGSDSGSQRVLSGLVQREINRQGGLLAEAIKDLQEQIRRWPPDYLYAVADTSFYIRHQDKLEDIDFAPLLESAWLDKRVVLIVPVLILDELDGLKERGPPRTRSGAPPTPSPSSIASSPSQVLRASYGCPRPTPGAEESSPTSSSTRHGTSGCPSPTTRSSTGHSQRRA